MLGECQGVRECTGGGGGGNEGRYWGLGECDGKREG